MYSDKYCIISHTSVLFCLLAASNTVRLHMAGDASSI